MAIGDAAVDAGMQLVNGATTPANQLDTEENRTRDYIAQHVAAERSARQTADNGKVDKPADGGNMARMEPGSIHSIGFYTNDDSTLFFRPVPTTAQYDRRVAMYSEIPAVPPPPDLSGVVSKAGDTMTGDLRLPNSFAATSGYTLAYINVDGRVSRGASARRFKKYISALDPLDLGDIFPQLVRYQMRSGDGDWKIGHIADDMAGTDAERFIVHDEDGAVLSIDFIALLLAQTAQLQAGLDLATQRIATLEARDAT